MPSSQLEYHLLHRLKFRQLKLLVTVDEQRNILKASKVLNMAQPAATKNIRDLEDLLGVSLFDRSSRGVTPTLYGDVVIKHAKLILSQIKLTSEEIISLKTGLSGHINVGTLLAASATIIPNSILEMRKDRPNISLTVLEGTNDKIMPALRSGELDIVIGRLPVFREREGLEQEVLYNEPISIIVRKGHKLAKMKNLNFKDLKEFDWILPPSQTSLRRQIETEFRNVGLEPPLNTIESISILTNFKLLSETDMVAAMPYHVIEHHPDLIRLPIALEAATSAIGVTFRSQNTPSPAVVYFVETLKKVAQKINNPQ